MARQSVAQQILDRVSTTPDLNIVTLIGDDGVEQAVSYKMLHFDALKLGLHLKASGVQQGDVVLITLPHSLGLVTVLLAAFYLGAIPSVLPYELSSPQRPLQLKQLKKLSSQASSAAIVTAGNRVKHVADLFSSDVSKPSVISPEIPSDLSLAETGDFEIFSGHTTEKPAYLQHTSGTTGLRKGALISAAAIGTCITEFSQRLRISNKADVIVNWLPIHHDYGMFAGLMTPLLTGTPVILMSAARVTRRPHALFQAIHKHKGTLCWSTNSALSFFAKYTSLEKMGGCDLSDLRVLCSGGEPTTLRSMQLFAEHFSNSGFDPNALMSGYGMAETTMGVTVCDPTAPRVVDWVDVGLLHADGVALARPTAASGAVSFVSNGTPLAGLDIKIVDQSGKEVPERRVGSIRIRGKTVFEGYLGNQGATRQALVDGWLSTNDTGYFADSHLFVIGRADDRIIVGGKTIHPEELEAIIQNLAQTPHSKLTGKAVAFGIFDDELGTEQIKLLCSTSSEMGADDCHGLELEIRERCKQQLDIVIHEVVFVPKTWIVTTANGKLPRRANAKKYLDERTRARTT